MGGLPRPAHRSLARLLLLSPPLIYPNDSDDAEDEYNDQEEENVDVHDNDVTRLKLAEP